MFSNLTRNFRLYLLYLFQKQSCSAKSGKFAYSIGINGSIQEKTFRYCLLLGKVLEDIALCAREGMINHLLRLEKPRISLLHLHD